jgi:hypothetical protein
MNIILGDENLKQIQENYIVLELETFSVGDDKTITAYCVLENTPLVDLNDLDRLKDLHKAFIAAYTGNNTTLCKFLGEELKGKFGGEMDTFYDEILARINN